MRIGIIGLPASGKSTVYHLLTHGQPSHQVGQLGEASIAVVKVPDPRLERLALMFQPKKVTPASVEIADFAPLVKESGKPASPGAQLLPQMRQSTALLMVVRGFTDERVPHIEGRIDPEGPRQITPDGLIIFVIHFAGNDRGRHAIGNQCRA